MQYGGRGYRIRGEPCGMSTDLRCVAVVTTLGNRMAFVPTEFPGDVTASSRSQTRRHRNPVGIAVADAGARQRSSLAGRDFVRSIRSWRAHRLAVDRATEVRSRSRDDLEGRPPRALPPGERLHAAGVAGAGSPPRDRPSSPACATPAVGVFDRRRGCPEVTSTGPPGCAERHADGRWSTGDEAPPAAAAKEIVRPGAAPYNRGSAVPRRPR